jgi:hypothetical protein
MSKKYATLTFHFAIKPQRWAIQRPVAAGSESDVDQDEKCRVMEFEG